MKRLFLVLAFAVSLTGCAALQAYEAVATTTVSAQQIYIAANTFDAIQATATQYLNYCRNNLSTAACSAPNRRVVIRGVRAGRAARNQLEVYLVESRPAPAQLYNTLIAVIKSLQASAATKIGAAQ